MELLLEHGADANAKSDDGRDALFRAAEMGHLQVVERLLSARLGDVNCRRLDGATPLHAAACKGFVRVVGSLLSFGADPSLRARLTGTPADLAKYFGQQKILRMIQEASSSTGAEPKPITLSELRGV